MKFAVRPVMFGIVAWLLATVNIQTDPLPCGMIRQSIGKPDANKGGIDVTSYCRAGRIDCCVRSELVCAAESIPSRRRLGATLAGNEVRSRDPPRCGSELHSRRELRPAVGETVWIRFS